jgi:hypothetical protein
LLSEEEELEAIMKYFEINTYLRNGKTRAINKRKKIKISIGKKKKIISKMNDNVKELKVLHLRNKEAYNQTHERKSAFKLRHTSRICSYCIYKDDKTAGRSSTSENGV